jgi:hypothetical protein
MKKLTDFITKTSTILHNNTAYRLIYFGIVIAALVLVRLYTKSESISFVYSEF